MSKIIINGTLFGKGSSGVQRYAVNMIKHFPKQIPYEIISSNCRINFFRHILEQFKFLMFPNRLIWSPTHIGPLFSRLHVITVHDLLPIDQSHLFDWKFVKLYKFILPILCRNSLHILTVSEFTKSRLIDVYGIKSDKITVAYNASIFSYNIKYSDINFKLLKSEYFISDNYFLVVGNIGFHKNSLNIIKAWRNSNVDADLVFIGKLPDHFKSEFYREKEFQFRVKHLENVDDETLALFYKNSVSLIFVSFYEGFGIPLLEANSMGCRVIYSKNTVLEEIAGDCNFPVDPFSVEAISNAICTLFNNPIFNIEELLNNSNKYNWEVESAKVQNVLKSYS